jgi:hypothetical protein
VRAAVLKNGLLLQYASKNLKNEKSIVLDAISNDSRAFYFASEKLKNDKDIILTSIYENLAILKYLNSDIQLSSNEIYTIEDLILQEFKKPETNLTFDYDLILKCLDLNLKIMSIVPSQLLSDHEFASAAIKRNPLNFEYISETLKDNFEIFSLALNLNVDILQFTQYSYLTAIVRYNPQKSIIIDITKRLLANSYKNASVKEVMKGILSLALLSLPMELKNYIDLFRQILPFNGFFLTNASETIQDNEQLIKKVISYCPDAFHCASERLQKAHQLIFSKVQGSSFQILSKMDDPIENEFLLKKGLLYSSMYLHFAHSKITENRTQLNQYKNGYKVEELITK